MTEASVDSTYASSASAFGDYNKSATNKRTILKGAYRRGWMGGLKRDKTDIVTTNFGPIDPDGDRKSSRYSLGIGAGTTTGQSERQRRSRLRNKFSAATAQTTKSVKSPSNKALQQTDPLFHLYLICVGLITLSILAIKCLIPGMPIYTHTVIGFAFLLVIIVVSTIYTQVRSRKVSRINLSSFVRLN